MPNPEWGVKRTCPTTGQRFYDLGKDPIISPYTGEVVELSTKPKAVDVAADLARAKAAEAAEEDLVDDDDLPENDADDSDDTAVVDDDDDSDDDDLNGPALSDEDSDDEPVEFDDDVLLDDNEDDDDDMGELGDVPKKGDDET